MVSEAALRVHARAALLVGGAHSSATTTRPQAHHLLNLGAAVNQPDARGWTPLHRAAVLAHLDGYLELYEFLLVRPGLLPVSAGLLAGAGCTCCYCTCC